LVFLRTSSHATSWAGRVQQLHSVNGCINSTCNRHLLSPVRFSPWITLSHFSQSCRYLQA